MNGAGAEARVAVIAMVYNEAVFLPQFLDHYSPQVETIYLLDNESDDGSIDVARAYPNVEVSTVSTGGTLNDGIQRAVKLAKKTECIGRCDYVLLPDADEFIVPKQGGTLKTALGTLPPSGVFGTQGFDMFKKPWEAPYDPALPLLQQRRWGTADVNLSKPIIIRPESPAPYSAGFHRLLDRDNRPLQSPDKCHFFLLHVAGLDEDLYVRRCMSRTTRMSEENVRQHWGYHYYGGNEAMFRERFRKASADPASVELPAFPVTV